MSQNIDRLISRYLSGVKQSGGNNIVAICPFHATKSGTPFCLNTKSGLWVCFSCGEKGTLSSFLYRMGLSRDRVSIALDKIKLDGPAPLAIRRHNILKHKWSVLPEYVLGAYDMCPKKMLDLGFEMELLADNDVGYDQRRDRITFAIRDYLGQLVGVSGRSHEDWNQPRYRVYDEDFYGVDPNYVASTKEHLYGLQTVYPARYFDPDADHPPLIIVEGYKGCLWLRQLGFTHAVALQGTIMTQHQERFLARMRGPFYVLLDWEEGKSWPDVKRRCAALSIARRLSRTDRTLICHYGDKPEGTSPDDLNQEDVEEALESAMTASEHVAQTIKQQPRRVRK